MRRTHRPLALALLLALAPSAAPADPAIERFAEALRLETVSHADPALFEPGPFLALHGHLRRSFPRVHATLERELIAGFSLLYTWRGADAGASPILVTSHLDVVPVPEETREAWEQPPFGGVVADDYVWGRGTLDDQIVDVHGDTVESDRVENSKFDRNTELGPDSVGAGHEHGFLVVPLEELLVEVESEHAGECPMRSENPGSVRSGHRALDLLDQLVAGDDIDPGLPVREA